MRTPLRSLLLIGCMATAPSLAAPVDPRQLHGIALGRHVFLTYCAGCHGFDGLAFFPSAPSFAMGDRLAKSDAQLMHSILNGRGAMPSWGDKLSRAWLEQALAYIRHMANVGESGRPPVHNERPDFYYIFVPLGTELIIDWDIQR